MSEIAWQKSSFSNEHDHCLELGRTGEGTLALRESDDPAVVLTTTPRRLAAFLAAVKGSSASGRSA